MGLFYVTPHHQFQLDELDEDTDISWFVIADTARNAISLWMQQFTQFTGIEISYAGAVTTEWLIELAEKSRADRVLEIRDLSFDAYASPGIVPWESILPTHFQIIEE